MKRTTKIALGAISMLASVTLLTACSSSGGSSSSGGKETIEVFSTKAENAATLKELAADFTKANPTITVKITAPADGGTVLKTRLTKNDIPDVVSGGGDANFLMLQKAGVLEDLSKQDYVSEVQDSYKSMVTSLYTDKALYGVPYATNASGILYNKDIFEKNGLTPPTTYDEFIAACKALKAKGIAPLEMTFKDSWTALAMWNSITPSLQPTNFGKDRLAGKVTFAADFKPIAKEFLDILNYAQPNYMGTSYDDGNVAFAQGKAAMLINGSWTIPVIKKSNANLNFGIIAFPATNTASKNYVSSGVDVLFAVNKDSKHQSADQKFIKFMLEKENAATYIKEQSAFSAVKGVEQTDKNMEGVKALIAKGQVADYPDHLYPAGFDLASLLQASALNKTNGMDESKNITDLLGKADKAYDTANVK